MEALTRKPIHKSAVFVDRSPFRYFNVKLCFEHKLQGGNIWTPYIAVCKCFGFVAICLCKEWLRLTLCLMIYLIGKDVWSCRNSYPNRIRKYPEFSVQVQFWRSTHDSIESHPASQKNSRGSLRTESEIYKIVRCHLHARRTFLSNTLMLGEHGWTRHNNPPRKGRHKTGRDLKKKPREPRQKIACCRCRKQKKRSSLSPPLNDCCDDILIFFILV